MNTHNLFISHSWTYGDQYERLISLLNERSYFSFQDYSVPKDDPVHDADNQSELRMAIKNHMTPCHVVIVLAGVYATYSKWINIELDLAEKGFTNRKPVLAIRPWGQVNLSARVRDSADRIVGWNTESVVSAIRDLSNA